MRVALAAAALAAWGAGAAGQLVDYGASCKGGAKCASGVCGTSCSARDMGTQFTTSCLCPRNRNATWAEPAPGCCGCLSYQPGKPAQLSVCRPDQTRSEQDATPLPQLAKGTLKTLYARLAEVGAMDDELVEAGVPRSKYLIESKHSGGINNADGNRFGAPCSSHEQCQFGICGTGCDCDSTIEEKCSCNCVSNFPFKTCGGCNRGEGLKGATVGPCPAGVIVTSFPGTSLWLPGKGEAVSLSYCILIALERKVNGAVFATPEGCTGSQDRKQVWDAIDGANAPDYATVEKLFELLAKRICETPPGTPCKCDYYALVDKLGKAAVDPSVCVVPPLQPATKLLGLRAQLRSELFKP